MLSEKSKGNLDETEERLVQEILYNLRMRYVEAVRGAFPDWRNRIDEILAVEDRVVARMTWSGTHRGRLGEIEPTGAHVEYCGAAFFRLAAGAIEEAWVVGDTHALWRALGAAEP